MTRIDEQLINTIRSQADIVDVISHYVPVQKKGKGFATVCPFHDDHDPSLSISVDKQIYKCFVCGAGGNVFTFVQKYENVSFMQAVAKVSDLVGLQYQFDQSYLQKSVDPELSKIWKLYQVANEYLTYSVLQNEAIMHYLGHRKISEDLIKYFDMGYNGENDVLSKYLVAKKFSESALVEANLSLVGGHSLVDVFKNRITIPIHDRSGNIIGYTARIVPPNEGAKYINTSNTKLYVKGDILFNFHRVKALGNKNQRVYVVEGAMDVIGLAKAGIKNAVATLGTSVTANQMKLLKQLNVDIVLFYDGDAAGKNATYRFGELANQYQLPFSIVKNPYEMDPDEIYMQYGEERLQTIVATTMSWIDFLFEHLKLKYDLRNYSDLKQYGSEIYQQIKTLLDPIESRMYIEKLYRITGFNYQQDEQKSTKLPYKRYNNKQDSKPVERLNVDESGVQRAQYELISQLLKSKMATQIFIEELGFLVGEDFNALAMYILEYYRHNEFIVVADFINFIKEENIQQLLLKIDAWSLAIPEFSMQLVKDTIIKIKITLLDQRIKALAEQVMMNPELYADLLKLKKERVGLLHGKER